jgi:hypothetical protein
VSSVGENGDGDVAKLLRRIAQRYLALGWPLLILQPGAKEPFGGSAGRPGMTSVTPTLDERVLLHLLDSHPTANLGVATGHPGPTVLDIDDVAQAPAEMIAAARALGCPEVATARGMHLYFGGRVGGGVVLPYGELRGQGQYVVAPPSIHPSGRQYVWTTEARGLLPAVPAEMLATAVVAGAGAAGELTRRIPAGEGRHHHLLDFAVRQVRAGILDEAHLLALIAAEFQRSCELRPAPRRNEFSDLVEWALRSNIAGRERAKTVEGKPKYTSPPADAPLPEHRAFLERHAGIAPLRLLDPVRNGPLLSDSCDLPLSNGWLIRFERLGDVTKTPSGWPEAVLTGTGGQASPTEGMKPAERRGLLRSICILAAAPDHWARHEAMADAVEVFLQMTKTEIVALVDGAAKYELVSRLYELPDWNPAKGVETRSERGFRFEESRPVLIEDTVEGRRYVRSSQLFDYLRWRGLAVASDYEVKLNEVGIGRVDMHGREAPTGGTRRKSHMRLCEITNWRHADAGDDDEE